MSTAKRVVGRRKAKAAVAAGRPKRGAEGATKRAKTSTTKRASARAPKRAKVLPLHLDVVDRGRPRTDRTFLQQVVRTALDFAQRPDLHVSLLLTDDAEIAQVHADFLDDPTPTDVISFDLDGAAELVVSVETAKRTAKSQGHALRAEVALYVVHGILHVCGFDDIRPRDRVRMRAAERAVLQRLALHVGAVDA